MCSCSSPLEVLCMNFLLLFMFVLVSFWRCAIYCCRCCRCCQHASACASREWQRAVENVGGRSLGPSRPLLSNLAQESGNFLSVSPSSFRPLIVPELRCVPTALLLFLFSMASFQFTQHRHCCSHVLSSAACCRHCMDPSHSTAAHMCCKTGGGGANNWNV